MAPPLLRVQNLKALFLGSFFFLFIPLAIPQGNSIKQRNPLYCIFPFLREDEPGWTDFAMLGRFGGDWQGIYCPGWQHASLELLWASGLSHVRLGHGSEGYGLGKRAGLFL